MNSLSINFLLTLLTLIYPFQGPVAPSFDIFCYPSRFDSKAEAFFRSNGFVTDNIEIMTQGSIVYTADKTNFDPAKVKRFLLEKFPEVDSRGMLLIDWEAGPYHDLKNYPATDERFKTAENKFLALLKEVRQHRPHLKLSFYGVPYRVWYPRQMESFNPSGKYDGVLSKVDWIAPSLYILFADEEVGHDKNLQYLKENLDAALVYGKKFNKPVVPFVWHRVHTGSNGYPYAIIQKEVFAKYVRYIASHSLSGYKASGVYWWDNARGRLNNLAGVDNHLNGKVYDAATYDAMIVDYAKAVKQALN